ncbi:ABC transporter permease [Roseivivax sediminis]|uniref:ABC-type polysaccharide/polyol phosphate export permease n=1 Tax=Roseivivax sediminis TaxID=936889 RepID=A0A1I2B5R7_9RHOB|nr:ABC transporter permease [Roseivivax sediminis]SFE50643.1 ABC-type polysaccharide/polyol phosphate export permease [Roseivivax sediminis]
MFHIKERRSRAGSALTLAEVVYHASVRSVRKTHGNAIIAIAINILQAVIFVAVFYFMFLILGLRGVSLRGDFLLYIMTGVFLFLTHTKTLGAVAGAEGPTSPMMQHAPMNTAVSILSAMLSTLYIQVLSLIVILFVYDAVLHPGAIAEINQPLPAFGMLLIAWFSGAAIGMVFMAIKPWAPVPVGIVTTIYQRANMIASGKMFVANSLPPAMLQLFDWNPLFHAIDQARGYTFVNYFPRNSSWEYAIWVAIVLLMVGLMIEFYTRRHASASWNARR